MSHPEIVLVTAADLPAQRDTELLVAELAREGVQAVVLPWDDPFDWTEVPLVVLRTPWDYYHRLDEFLAWTAHIDRVTRLHNPAAVVTWNSHKGYLLDLQARGVPILPTQLLQSTDDPAVALRAINSATGELVVKPAVGVGAIGAKRGRGDDPALLQHAEALLAAGDVLVQPFAPEVVHGEVSLIYFEDVFSHAVRKRPAAGEFRVQDDYGGTVHPYEPTQAEHEVAVAALRVTQIPVTYARVDLVHFEGGPAVMELEVIEPELFLRHAPGSAARFAQALKRALRE